MNAVIARIAPPDRGAMAEASARQGRLTKPQGALGRLEEISVWLAGVQGRPIPHMANKLIIVAAADHGVAAQSVSAYPQEVSVQMALNFLRGGAAVNVLARQIGARVVVVDAGLARDVRPLAGSARLPDSLVSLRAGEGTRDISLGPAMSRDDALQTIISGMRMVQAEASRGADIVGVGEMGIANTTSASAVAAAITGLPPSEVTGRGTGIDDGRLRHKIGVIERSIAVNQPDPSDALDVLAKVGGFEMGLLAGAMLGAASLRKPVVLDGFITTAAALIACGLCPGLRPYLLASHLSAESGHRLTLNYLGLRPILDLDMRLGEGTGACLAMQLVEAAARCLREMATFEEAGVSSKE